MEMEIDDGVRRPDGSVIQGLTLSEWEKLEEMFNLVSLDELCYLRDLSTAPTFDKTYFESEAELLHSGREEEALRGRRALPATSLFMLLSVHLKPRKRKSSSVLSVYGEITSSPDISDYYYKSELEDAQHFESSDGGYLTLHGPTIPGNVGEAFSLFRSRMLSIRLYDQHGQHLLVDNEVILDYSPHDFEHVNVKLVQTTEISLTLKYVSIPMAVHGILQINIFDRKLSGYDPDLKSFEDVHGKVVASYKSKSDNYVSQKFVLFDKNASQYERVSTVRGDNLLSSSRGWVVAPAMSLLTLDIDLSNSQQEPIFTGVVELGTDNSYRSRKNLVSDKYHISVSASWHYPFIPPPAEERLGYVARRCVPFAPRTPQPLLDSAIEVFSVLISYKKCRSEQIHGHIRFTSNWELNEPGIDIFKREKEEPLTLIGRGHTITTLKGARLHTDFDNLTLICDLDGSTNGSSIKGFHDLDLKRCCGQQLCSIFEGDDGFAALHYAVFSSALQANLKIYVHQRKGSQCDVSGSICAQYKYFDYSSQYKKNCYRIVLFKREEDLVQTDEDGLLPLSRSSVVVPSYSSMIFDLDLMIGTQKLSRQIEVENDTCITMVGDEEGCLVRLVLKWSEVK